ncbi:MAG: DUF6345 domain-containing protein [Candidatus Bipolaricaulia bacterium]
MQRLIFFSVFVLLLLATARLVYAIPYDMACVEKYSDAGFSTSADVSLTCDATDGFSFWFNLFGTHNLRYYWHDTLVWPRDYTEDSFVGGGDNIEVDWSSADLAVFSGHGSCQNPPTATSPDFIVTAKKNIGTAANFVDINASMRLGEFPGSGVFGSNGNLNTLMINASCPMDLVSLTTQWWTVFQGLHLAMGHSGTTTQDNLDSDQKLPTVGLYLAPLPFFGSSSYRTAWMSAGLIDVQSGVCAVITATGRTEAEAVARRDFETPTVRIGDALPATWIAWRWTCKG